MNYIKIDKCDAANGTGIRVTLFVSGCRCHCKGCFSPETWDFGAGVPFTVSAENEVLAALAPDYVAGVTLLGGNPTEPENEAVLVPFVKRIRDFYGDRKNVWLYTGNVFEDLVNRGDELVGLCDVVVDGPFVEELKDLSLKFRGSSNQRIIDVRKSLESGKTMEVE